MNAIKSKTIPAEKIEQIKNLFAHGIAKESIASQLGVSKGTINRYVGIQHPPLTDNTKKAIIALYKKGKYQFEIAEIFSISRATVSKILSKTEKYDPYRKAAEIKIAKNTKAKMRKLKKDKREEKPRTFKTLKPVKEGTRPVKIKPGLIVHAKFNETDKQVIERWNKKLSSK